MDLRFGYLKVHYLIMTLFIIVCDVFSCMQCGIYNCSVVFWQIYDNQLHILSCCAISLWFICLLASVNETTHNELDKAHDVLRHILISQQRQDYSAYLLQFLKV